MWRNLADLMKVIPESKWKYFRKHRFKCRFIDGASRIWAVEHINKHGGSFRLGRVYITDYGCNVNIVPTKNPAQWTTTSVEHVEVYISHKAYIEKLAPIVLSQ